MKNEKYEIIWSPEAYRNIQDMYEFILKELGMKKYADKILRKIFKVINGLKLFPLMYPKIYIDKKLKRQLRRIIVEKYIILYEVKRNKQIFILHIFHENQNYLNLKNLFKND